VSSLASTIAAKLERASVPGASLAIARGESIELLQVGLASLAPRRSVERVTTFHLFSGTKLYTAAAIMRLVERGALALGHAVTDYLPDLRLAHPITIAELASHSSGLPETLRAFLAVHFEGERAPSTAEALARYDVSRGGRPRGRVAYRNVNYAILGEVVSRVSGRPYADFVKSEILEPLGSDATFALVDPERAAVGYLPRFSPVRLALPLLLPGVGAKLYGERSGRLIALAPYDLDTSAIGGLHGSARSFAPLLLEMLSDRDGLLTRASKREMLSVRARGAAGVVSRTGVGIGWKVGDTPVRFFNHEGGGAGFCSETRLYPEHALGIVLLMNRSQSRGLSRLAHDICELIRTA
jgi:CubicO group peptidase (beta-lactamase class C family)